MELTKEIDEEMKGIDGVELWYFSDLSLLVRYYRECGGFLYNALSLGLV